MTTSLSAARVVLLAVHLATKADIDSLTALRAQHSKILKDDLLLRILLTCLPETIRSDRYVSLVERIEAGNWTADFDSEQLDYSSVRDITDDEASKKVRRLHLLPLTWKNAPEDALQDPVSLFLVHRSHRVDQEAGMLTQLPDLIVPFLDHAPCIRTWMISALLPLLRRNYEFYPNSPISQTLSAFELLSDHDVVALLLSETGVDEQNLPFVGRDLRSLIGPWLYNEARWTRSGDPGLSSENGHPARRTMCPAWEEVLEWLTTQASKSWKVAVKAIDQWDGPDDVDLGGYGSMWLGDDEKEHLELRYARAALACAYLIPEASVEALVGANAIISKIMALLDQHACPTLQVASSLLPPFAEVDGERLLQARNATYMRNDLIDDSNPLTTPNKTSTSLLHILTLSAFILTKGGASCTVRRAGELALLQEEREQKSEAIRLINSLSNNGPMHDDKYWIRARNEILWLRDWDVEEHLGISEAQSQGVFGQLSKEFLEIECLKAFLSHSRYSLARAIYEDSPEPPLREAVIRENVVAAAMNAYDNASNPHRGRGGLLKCDDIIHAFPSTLGPEYPDFKRIDALLKATHALGEYRLVLRKGEPFMPAVLRVHLDPIAIIGKILEQNPKSYTKIQDFLEIGVNIINAGLLAREKSQQPKIPSVQPSIPQSHVARRITAMCVDAALTEDDYETAYSYVVNRIGPVPEKTTPIDDFSWKAALEAGKYRRTARTMKPTHIGTASGNPAIRHLEQRIECLSTALRIAPPATLQEILKVFRKCEEELHAAVKAEEAQESAWDDQGDMQAMPGAFSSTVPAGVVKTTIKPSRAVEEAPMSLFDLSRAGMARAQRNFSALSSLQRSENARSDGGQGPTDDGSGQLRTRKRDQLREAAVGTLASGVGWLIGAQPVDKTNDER